MHVLTAEDLDDDWDEEDDSIFCPFCLERGYKIRLGPKILMPNEPRPDDYENFLECGTCGWICPLYSVEKEATIQDSIETSSSPYEDNKTIIENVFPKRSSPAGKKLSAKKKRNKIKVTNDPDIQREIDQHGEDNVRVVFDSNP
jgi:hypothetical protein